MLTSTRRRLAGVRASRALELPSADLPLYKRWLDANGARLDGVELVTTPEGQLNLVAVRDLPPNFICSVVPRRLRVDSLHPNVRTSVCREVFDNLLTLRDTTPTPVARAFPQRTEVLASLPTSLDSILAGPFAQLSTGSTRRLQAAAETPVVQLLLALDAAVSVLADADGEAVFSPWMSMWADRLPVFPPTEEFVHLIAGLDATAPASSALPPDTPPLPHTTSNVRPVCPDHAFGAPVRVAAGPPSRFAAWRSFPLYSTKFAAAAIAQCDAYDVAWTLICEALPTRIVAAFPHSTESLRWAVWSFLSQSARSCGLYTPHAWFHPSRCPVVDALAFSPRNASALAAWPAPNDTFPLPLPAIVDVDGNPEERGSGVVDRNLSLRDVGALVITRRGVTAGEALTVPPPRGAASWHHRLLAGGPADVPDALAGFDEEGEGDGEGGAEDDLSVPPPLIQSQYKSMAFVGELPEERSREAVETFGHSVIQFRDRSLGKKRLVVDGVKMFEGVRRSATAE